MYRYRNNIGNTKSNIESLKYLNKVGQFKYVYAYRYKGRYNTSHIAVRVVGDKGSCRFSGFSWGYNGEGTRGLEKLFKVLKVDKSIFDCVMKKEWPNFIGKNEVFWQITISK